MVTIKAAVNPLETIRTTTPTPLKHDQLLVKALDDPDLGSPQRSQEPDVQATLSLGKAWSQVKD
jgi:hypothetical protein